MVSAQSQGTAPVNQVDLEWNDDVEAPFQVKAVGTLSGSRLRIRLHRATPVKYRKLPVTAAARESHGLVSTDEKCCR